MKSTAKKKPARPGKKSASKPAQPFHYEVPFQAASTITLIYGNAKVTLTGQELFNIADLKKRLELKEAELQKVKNEKPIPSIPKMEDANKLRDIHNVLSMQGADGNWNSNPYQFGMFNGMELIASIIEGRTTQYKEKPAKWLDKDEQEHRERMEQKNGVNMTVNEREQTADEVVAEFMDRLIGREQIFAPVLHKITERIMWKLQHDAELLGERTAVARKRFEEALSIVTQFSPKR